MSESDAITHWLGRAGSLATREAYERDLELLSDFARSLGVGVLNLSFADLELWRDEQAHSSAATAARRVSAASSFYRFATSLGLVDVNPVDSVERPHPAAPDTVLTCEESEAVLAAAKEVSAKALTLVCLLLVEGVRLNTALALEVAQVQGSRTVTLALAPSPLRLDRRSAQAVKAQVAGRSSGPLFTGDSAVNPNRDARLTRFGADYLLKRTGRRAEVSVPLSAGLLRRTWRRDTQFG